MKRLIWMLRIWKDGRGQDLIEYALLAAFVATAAAAVTPTFATSLSTIYSKMASVMAAASAS